MKFIFYFLIIIDRQYYISFRYTTQWLTLSVPWKVTTISRIIILLTVSPMLYSLFPRLILWAEFLTHGSWTCLTLRGSNKLFFKVVVPISTSTSSVWVLGSSTSLLILHIAGLEQLILVFTCMPMITLGIFSGFHLIAFRLFPAALGEHQIVLCMAGRKTSL